MGLPPPKATPGAVCVNDPSVIRRSFGSGSKLARINHQINEKGSGERSGSSERRLAQSFCGIVDQLQLLASPPRGSGIKIFPKASGLPFATIRLAPAPLGIASFFSTLGRTASRRAGIP